MRLQLLLTAYSVLRGSCTKKEVATSKMVTSLLLFAASPLVLPQEVGHDAEEVVEFF